MVTGYSFPDLSATNRETCHREFAPALSPGWGQPLPLEDSIYQFTSSPSGKFLAFSIDQQMTSWADMARDTVFTVGPVPDAQLQYGPCGQYPLNTGSSASVFDAPGIAATEPGTGSPATFAFVTWAFQLNVSVFVTGFGWTPCPEVDWTSFVLLTSTFHDGTVTQEATGGVNVLTPPTP